MEGKTGHWIFGRNFYDGVPEVECSTCGKTYPMWVAMADEGYIYCPRCGSRNGGSEEYREEMEAMI